MSSNDLNTLREQWRLAALEHARLDDVASRMEEGRSIVQAEIVLGFVTAGESVAKAQLLARTSERWKKYVRSMHDCRAAANVAKIEAQDHDRAYWQQNNSEADQRSERRMSR